jgi:hypothetical protein
MVIDAAAYPPTRGVRAGLYGLVRLGGVNDDLMHAGPPRHTPDALDEGVGRSPGYRARRPANDLGMR